MLCSLWISIIFSLRINNCINKYSWDFKVAFNLVLKNVPKFHWYWSYKEGEIGLIALHFGKSIKRDLNRRHLWLYFLSLNSFELHCISFGAWGKPLSLVIPNTGMKMTASLLHTHNKIAFYCKIFVYLVWLWLFCSGHTQYLWCIWQIIYFNIYSGWWTWLPLASQGNLMNKLMHSYFLLWRKLTF